MEDFGAEECTVTGAVHADQPVLAEVGRRWRAIDRMLPVPVLESVSCGARLDVRDSDGGLVALGSCRHRHFGPDSPELAWGAEHQFGLTPYVAGFGPQIGVALDDLLATWREHLTRQPDAAQADSAALVRWPSRDIDGVRALLGHGLHPLVVIAARPRGRSAESARLADGSRHGLRIRRAGLADIDVVVAFALELLRWDEHFGSARLRPHGEHAERENAQRRLAHADPWIWLAERDGQAVGMVAAEPPESTGWISPLVSVTPVAYIGEMAVLPELRGTGIGAALIAHLHARLDAVGVAVTLLHYAQLNPLSVPFWSRMGYRPLWTCWETRPAVSER
jgi:GNAT superfamily N-acetyltransferase